jgi:hypothetical protein
VDLDKKDIKTVFMKKPLLVALLLSFLCVGTARADDWDFVVAPYGVLPSISGNASLGRIDDQDVDVDAGDILKSLDMGAMLQVEARHTKSNVGVMLNYAFMDLSKGVTGPLGFTDVDADIFQGTLEGFYTYRSYFEHSTLDTYAGARWWDINLDVNATTPRGSRSYSRDVDWVDPVIGLRWATKIADSWRLLLQGDIGGFGAASDFSWNTQVGVLWDASESFSLALLYKAISVDYQTGVRGTKDFFEYDTITQGPLIGLVFRL